MKRHAAAILVIAAGLAAPALTAVPASAGSGTSSVGCSTGDSCTVMLENMVHFGGRNYSPGANNMVVNIQPPPCLWEPIGNAVTGSQSITSQYGTNPKTATSLYQVNTSVQQAVTLQKTKPAGQWYMLPVNQAAGAAGVQQCLQMPLFAWVPVGQAPPGINLPPQTLAQLVLVNLPIPTAGRMSLNPTTGRTFTNLPTFVRVALVPRNHTGYETGANGMPYVTMYATLGGVSATVWVYATHLQVSASGGPAYTPDTSNCGYLGSQMMTNPQAVANIGPGGPIDCGATFQAPATWQITATMNWQTCWAPIQSGGAPPANCVPVPGAQLKPPNWTRPVFVREIQSVNNGAG
jgi:hypothetical protein